MSEDAFLQRNSLLIAKAIDQLMFDGAHSRPRIISRDEETLEFEITVSIDPSRLRRFLGLHRYKVQTSAILTDGGLTSNQAVILRREGGLFREVCRTAELLAFPTGFLASLNTAAKRQETVKRRLHPASLDQ